MGKEWVFQDPCNPDAGRMVLAAAGDVDHDTLVATAKSLFSGLPTNSHDAATLVAAEPSYFTGSSVSVRDPDTPATSLAIAFQGAPWNSPDSTTLQVMQVRVFKLSRFAVSRLCCCFRYCFSLF
jgi:predicted Zn-dependent peptidase